MNKQEIIDEINKTKEHLANMEKMLKECNGRWKPELNEEYYYVKRKIKTNTIFELVIIIPINLLSFVQTSSNIF